MEYEKRQTNAGPVYTARVELEADPITGKRKRTRITAKTEKELRRLITAAEHRVHTGTYIEPGKQSLREYLDDWLAKKGAGESIRPTTYRSYEQLIRVHILPALGNVRLQKLTAAQLESFYAERLGYGLSPRTVRYLHTILRQALQRAYELGTVPRNVATMAKPPKGSRPAISTWDVSQLRSFLQAADCDGYAPIWLLAISTGMRRGELLGLRWDDVDLAKGRIHVRRALAEIGSELRIQEPKTKSSRRVVPLSGHALAALKEHRSQQLQRRLRLGPLWNGNSPEYGDLVFTTADGKPIAPRNLIRRFKELSTVAKLPALAFHGLRHAHATQLLRDGISAKVVSERLGHASIALTLDTYSHVLPDMQDAAVATIDRALFGT